MYFSNKLIGNRYICYDDDDMNRRKKRRKFFCALRESFLMSSPKIVSSVYMCVGRMCFSHPHKCVTDGLPDFPSSANYATTSSPAMIHRYMCQVGQIGQSRQTFQPATYVTFPPFLPAQHNTTTTVMLE